MKKKVRIVWLITIIAACLVIGVQSYWLYSQYVYATDQYIHEIINTTDQLMIADYKIRNRNSKTSFAFNYNINTEYKKEEESVKNVLVISTGEKADSIKEPMRLALSLKDSLLQEDRTDISWIKKDTFRIDAPEALFYEAIQHYLAEAKSSLKKDHIDSLLTTALPEVPFTSSYFTSDSMLWDKQWKSTSTLFKSTLELIYPYSPLERKCLLFTMKIPVNPLLKGMFSQLLMGLVFILILVGCLVFQLRVIFKQRELSVLQYSFVNTMIHELKRPVQTLKMLISFLNNKEMRKDQTVNEQVVQDSLSELDRLSAYLTKLKDMVRADGAETLLHNDLFDVKEVVEKTIRTVYIPADKQVAFSTSYQPENMVIEADSIHFSNMLNNLIENAIKYSDSKVDILIEMSLHNKQFVLSVSDNGFGISKDDQEHIFEKFYRGSNLADSQIPGIGLGLSYVKLITDAHNGNIALRSRIGEGTTIIIRLPQ